MAAERYLSRRIPDLRVGNNIDEIDKKLIPASIHPCLLSMKADYNGKSTMSVTICLSLSYYCARYYFLNIFVFEFAIGSKSLLRYPN